MPEGDDLILTDASHGAIVAAEGNGKHLVGFPVEGFETVPRCNIPKSDRFVAATARQPLTVGTQGDRINSPIVSGIGAIAFASFHVPKFDAFVATAAH